MRNPLLVLLLLLAATATMIPAASAQSAEVPQFAIAPVGTDDPYFTLTIAPGERQDLRFAVANQGAEPAPARIYAADVYSLLNGGFGAMSYGEPISGTTTWLTLESGVVVLPPGEPVERSFSVQVPADAAPGEYITSLVIENADPVAIGGDESGSVVLNQVVRRVIAVAITLPGPRTPRLEIPGATYEQMPSYARVLVAVKNSGNVLLKPAGEISLVDAGGQEIYRLPVAMGSVYAGTETAIEFILPQPLAAGDYTVAVALADEKEALSVEIPDLPLLVPVPDPDGDTVAPAGPQITAATIVETRDPSSNALLLVEAVVTIEHQGLEIRDARVILHVSRDGQPVESFPLATSLVLVSGPLEIRQRYLPLDGWLPGTYTFSVTLEVVDPTTGAVTVLATADISTQVMVE